MTTTILRIYDNGGKTFDRYTVIPPRTAYRTHRESYTQWAAIGSSENPFHPQGFGQHCLAVPGPHLGKRITWEQLPINVQSFARQAFPEFFLNLKDTHHAPLHRDHHAN